MKATSRLSRAATQSVFEKYSEDTDPSRFFAGCQMIVANARTGAT
jgi:hypothetical protein